MNPHERRRLEELAVALREREIRDMRRRHRSRGGLIHFIRDFWHILEPVTPFVDGWPLWAMCMHLEAVTRGEITRLLINIPPGSTKSMVVNVFWPAWEWAAMERPGERYVSFSYAAYLTERDNQRFLDLLSDARFRAVWPIILTERGKVKVSNSGKGWKFASSVGGVGTGERGSRILCFPEDALVSTEQGAVPIGMIVRERLDVRVWSMDTRTRRLELRQVTGWRHNPGSPLVKVNLSDGGSIRCTPDHRILTQRGWIAAADLRPAPCGMSADRVFPFAHAVDFASVLSVEDDGHAMETFCLTVEGNHNMFVGAGREVYLVSNCDDLHNIKEGESEKVREETVRWFREAMSNRLNDMTTGAIIVIMQRVHADDVSGAALEDGGWVHLCIPMEYDPARRCETVIGWRDPRTVAGECFWTERFPPEAVALCKKQGPFAWASQYQQTPEIRAGGLLPRASWRMWDQPRFPRLDFVLASLDPAFTKQDKNDPSGLTVWGSFRTRDGERAAILLYAWRKWLELHGPDCDREAQETWDDYRARTSHQWGLVEHTADACKRFGADALLIESKASGHSVAQEMARLYRGEKWRVHLVDPRGLDKQARALRVQGELTGGLVFAPERPWATMVIDECAQFPRGKYADLVDSTTQAIWWFKQSRLIQRRSEYAMDEHALRENSLKRDAEAPLYPT